MKINYKKVFLGLIILVMLVIATPVLAANVNHLLQGIDCINNGSCTVCDLIQVGVNASQMIIGFVGVAVFLLFIYGGILWMIAFGDNKKIEEGKLIIKSAVIGMIIILFSYSLVELLWGAFRGNVPFSNVVNCTRPNYSQTGGGQETEVTQTTTGTQTSTGTDGTPIGRIKNYFSGDNSKKVIFLDRTNNQERVTIGSDGMGIEDVDKDVVPDEILELMLDQCPLGSVCAFYQKGIEELPNSSPETYVNFSNFVNINP